MLWNRHRCLKTLKWLHSPFRAGNPDASILAWGLAAHLLQMKRLSSILASKKVRGVSILTAALMAIYTNWYRHSAKLSMLVSDLFLFYPTRFVTPEICTVLYYTLLVLQHIWKLCQMRLYSFFQEYFCIYCCCCPLIPIKIFDLFHVIPNLFYMRRFHFFIKINIQFKFFSKLKILLCSNNENFWLCDMLRLMSYFRSRFM